MAIKLRHKAEEIDNKLDSISILDDKITDLSQKISDTSGFGDNMYILCGNEFYDFERYVNNRYPNTSLPSFVTTEWYDKLKEAVLSNNILVLQSSNGLEKSYNIIYARFNEQTICDSSEIICYDYETLTFEFQHKHQLFVVTIAKHKTTGEVINWVFESSSYNQAFHGGQRSYCLDMYGLSKIKQQDEFLDFLSKNSLSSDIFNLNKNSSENDIIEAFSLDFMDGSQFLMEVYPVLVDMRVDLYAKYIDDGIESNVKLINLGVNKDGIEDFENFAIKFDYILDGVCHSMKIYKDPEFGLKCNVTKSIKHKQAELLFSNWKEDGSSYSYTINDADIIDGCIVNAFPTRESEDIANAISIYKELSPEVGKITLYARTKPAANITIKYTIEL